jgi:hypothetical protein
MNRDNIIILFLLSILGVSILFAMHDDEKQLCDSKGMSLNSWDINQTVTCMDDKGNTKIFIPYSVSTTTLPRWIEVG